LEVGQDGWVLLGAGGAEGFEGFEGDDPWTDGGAEVFAEEWAEGDVFPGLDVAG
jgi:hypothetical protein